MSQETKEHKRKKLRWRRRTRPGAAPGTLIHDPEAPRPVIYVIAYGPEELTERAIDRPEALRDLVGKWPVIWVNIDGLGDASVIASLGEVFNLHRLALEDVLNVHQRPKVEPYGETHFIVARMVTLKENLETEQLSMFLGKSFVLTFQETVGDCFGPIRDRIRQARGRIRQAGSDYLAYALLDAVVDNFFPLLEQYGERLETLEDEVIAEPDRRTVAKIHQVKRDLLTLRRAIWPLRDAFNSLCRDPTPLITEETRLYLRDCYDHAVRLMDLVETYREIGIGLMDVYLSSLSNRLNEVMKVLTIIATIFIPLSFIASVYGMNFNTEKSPWNMPELDWYLGYPLSLALMAAVALGLLGFFWRKGWLSSPRVVEPPPPPKQPPPASKA